jgi:hypothetical protein
MKRTHREPWLLTPAEALREWVRRRGNDPGQQASGKGGAQTIARNRRPQLPKGRE